MKASHELYDQIGLDDVTRLRESLDKGAAWTKDAVLMRWGWKDRRFRLAVAALRQLGYPVIAMSEAGSTYRKARTRAELVAFVERELVSRSRDLEAQIRALLDGADQHFGTDQLALAI